MYISNKRNRTLWIDLWFRGEQGKQVNQGIYRRTRDIHENQGYTGEPGIQDNQRYG